MIRALSVVLAWMALAPSLVCAQDTVDGFVAGEFRSARLTMPYRLFVPANLDRNQKYPLVIYLHGSGGAGTDNLKQISGGNHPGTHAWTAPQLQERVPLFVVAPQAAAGEQWGSTTGTLSRFAAGTVALVRELERDFPIDSDRIVLTGQSRGGWGAWDLAQKRPDLFAAVIPLCGGGDPTAAETLRHVPVWAFHGALDSTVPVSASREMVDALKGIGADVRYTEYPDLGHGIWDRVYQDTTVINWALRQTRSSRNKNEGG